MFSRIVLTGLSGVFLTAMADLMLERERNKIIKKQKELTRQKELTDLKYYELMAELKALEIKFRKGRPQ
jgi:hypothetical protein